MGWEPTGNLVDIAKYGEAKGKLAKDYERLRAWSQVLAIVAVVSVIGLLICIAMLRHNASTTEQHNVNTTEDCALHIIVVNDRAREDDKRATYVPLETKLPEEHEDLPGTSVSIQYAKEDTEKRGWFRVYASGQNAEDALLYWWNPTTERWISREFGELLDFLDRESNIFRVDLANSETTYYFKIVK